MDSEEKWELFNNDLIGFISVKILTKHAKTAACGLFFKNSMHYFFLENLHILILAILAKYLKFTNFSVDVWSLPFYIFGGQS